MQNPEDLHFEKEYNCFITLYSKKEPNNPGLNRTATLLQGFLELSNVKIGEEQKII
ncbi:hypothetical protein LEP1GSC170_3624 [Leptospira interrogans serovar Bataviae str. HAI135]|nr:hypothetical protein LEP1GSC170_3624 [Leptospira interrogans serovar Bataviae str. HAI135]